MKGDFSRNTFRRANHYSGVRMQQGRVQIDADWNEQVDLQSHLDQATRGDLIGRCGTPQSAGQSAEETGFAIRIVNGVPSLNPGHYYVDGVLCENEQLVALSAQPDLPDEPLPTARGKYLAYLDVWQQHVTALDEPGLREVALGGPDTATRTRTAWQVRLMPLGQQRCEDLGRTWFPEPQSSGALAARSVPGAVSDNPCIVPASGGYRRLENQLYRVEVHDSGMAGDEEGNATFKWSRDNGVLAARVTRIMADEHILELDELGKDAYRRIQPGQWIELSSKEWTLRGRPGVMLRVEQVTGTRLQMYSWDAELELPEGEVLTARAWEDVEGAVLRNISADTAPRRRSFGPTWLPLESGVEVMFQPGYYRTGDYWLIPARTVKADVLWPRDGSGEPVSEKCHGTPHHYCALAVLTLDEESLWSVTHDCRRLFPPLTQLTTLVYAGGDGQEARPGEQLAKPLRAGVFNGQTPVPWARVGFRVVEGEGSGQLMEVDNMSNVGTSIVATTDAEGIVEVWWTPESTGWPGPDIRQSQRVEAFLLDQDGTTRVHAPLRYTASLSVATHVGYYPNTALEVLNGQDTVQKALDTLCDQLELSYEGGDGQEVMPRGPAQMLDKPLRVGVARHQKRVVGAQVRFTVLAGEGSLTGGPNSGTSIVVSTGSDGIAEVWWTPGTTVATQQVRAAIVVPTSSRAVPAEEELHLPLLFTCRLSRADLVSYVPQRGDEVLAGVNTVQGALDTLSNQFTLYYGGGDGQEVAPGGVLPRPLSVGVSHHQKPVNDAGVRFRVVEGSGLLREAGTQNAWASSILVKTRSRQDGASGLAQVEWRADDVSPIQQVEARLELGNSAEHLPVRFITRLRRELAFQYAGGDGQETARGAFVPAPLQVAVTDGSTPVAGALVRFRVTVGDQNYAVLMRDHNSSERGPEIFVPTGANGIASCLWQLDGKTSVQQVEAALMKDRQNQSALPPITFTATFAEQEPVVSVTRVELGPPSAPMVVEEGTIVFSPQPFHAGLRIFCNEVLQGWEVVEAPVVTLTVDAPFPLSMPEFEWWQSQFNSYFDRPFSPFLAIQPLVLHGSCSAVGNTIQWTPSEDSADWVIILKDIAARMMVPRLLVKLWIRGGFFRSNDGFRGLYGHPRYGGDFERWFWLGLPEIPRKPLSSGMGGVAELPQPAREPRARGGKLEERPTKPTILSGLKQAWGMVRDPKRRELLVADTDANAVLRFPLEGSSVGKAVETIRGGQIVQPTALALEPERGELFVANGGDSIAVFRRTAEGGFQAARELSGRRTGLLGPLGLALDPARKGLFVAGSGRTQLAGLTVGRPTRSVFLSLFDLEAEGDVEPRARWSGEALGLSRAAGLAIDLKRGELFVADYGEDAIRVYSLDALHAGKERVEPVRVLQGKATSLSQPIGLSLDASGKELWVANAKSGAITVHARDAAGDQAPSRTLEAPEEQRRALRGVLA